MYVISLQHSYVKCFCDCILFRCFYNLFKCTFICLFDLLTHLLLYYIFLTFGYNVYLSLYLLIRLFAYWHLKFLSNIWRKSIEYALIDNRWQMWKLVAAWSSCLHLTVILLRSTLTPMNLNMNYCCQTKDEMQSTRQSFGKSQMLSILVDPEFASFDSSKFPQLLAGVQFFIATLHFHFYL